MFRLEHAFILISFLVLVSSSFAQNNAALGSPPWQNASVWPDRVIQNFNGDPSSSITVTWRTDSSVQSTIAQIAPATADARFDVASESVIANTEAVYLSSVMIDGVRLTSPDNAGLSAAHYHSVVFRNLEPDTLYAYRVQGAEGAWSEWIQTRTAPESGPVKFVYFNHLILQKMFLVHSYLLYQYLIYLWFRTS